MTTNTPAPAQEARLTADQEIDAIMEQAQVFASAWAFLGGPFDNGSGLETAEREKANLRALLSKLRAPVATTTDRAMLQSVLQDLENSDSVCPRCGYSDSCADMDVAHMIRDHLRTEVRAPVAGEAHKPVGTLLNQHGEILWHRKPDYFPADFYAAPQASEAVRDAARLDYLESLREQAKEKRYQWDGWRFYALQNDLTIREQLDAALSAQPGAQKNGGSDAG